MSLNEIRAMDYYDFEIHVLMCITKESERRGGKTRKRNPTQKEILQKLGQSKVGELK